MRIHIILAAIAAMFSLAAVAQAVPIHVHEKVPVHHEAVVGKTVDGELAVHRWTTTKTVVRVEHVAPVDEDEDGIADSEDDCVFCAPPPPPAASSDPYAGTDTSTYTAPSSGGYAIPDYIVQCESGGDYGAVNSSSGADGAYQILPSTSASYGCDMSTPAGQDACAAEIYAAEGSSPWSCG